MPSINGTFMAARLRPRYHTVDSPSLAMLFSGDARRMNGIIIFEAPIFADAHRTSVPISRGDPPTP